MQENIGWVFNVADNIWTQLSNTDDEYIQYIADIKNSSGAGGVAGVEPGDKSKLKKNYYLTKTIADDNKIIYIDKPVEYNINIDHSDDESDNANKYYNLWKKDLIERLRENIPAQAGGKGPNDFERWINANGKLYLVYYNEREKNEPKNNYYAIYYFKNKNTNNNNIIYNYHHVNPDEEAAPADEASQIVESIKLTYDKKIHNIKIEFKLNGGYGVYGDWETKNNQSINYISTFNYEDYFEDTNTSIFRPNGIPILKKNFVFPSNAGRIYSLKKTPPHSTAHSYYHNEVQRIRDEKTKAAPAANNALGQIAQSVSTAASKSSNVAARWQQDTTASVPRGSQSTEIAQSVSTAAPVLQPKELADAGAAYARVLAAQHAYPVQGAINTIAAALIFNKVSPKDSYDVFDVDDNGQVSLSDLQSAVTHLQLDISEQNSKDLFESLDADKTGFIPKAAWLEAIAEANTKDILKSRGFTNTDNKATLSGESAVQTQESVQVVRSEDKKSGKDKRPQSARARLEVAALDEPVQRNQFPDNDRALYCL